MRTVAFVPLVAGWLLAVPAAAEVPGGHVYVGAGLSFMMPAGSANGLQPLHNGAGGSLEVTGETAHLLVALALEYGASSGAQPEYGLAALRAGAILGSGSTAPYLAGGLGLMRITASSTSDCVGGSCVAAEGSGAAGTVEAGVLFFRDRQLGRVALAARLIEPFFEVKAGGATAGATVPLVLFTLRLLL